LGVRIILTGGDPGRCTVPRGIPSVRVSSSANTNPPQSVNPTRRALVHFVPTGFIERYPQPRPSASISRISRNPYRPAISTYQGWNGGGIVRPLVRKPCLWGGINRTFCFPCWINWSPAGQVRISPSNGGISPAALAKAFLNSFSKGIANPVFFFQVRGPPQHKHLKKSLNRTGLEMALLGAVLTACWACRAVRTSNRGSCGGPGV